MLSRHAFIIYLEGQLIMRRWNQSIISVVLAVSCLGLISCSGFPPRIYRMDVQQGNAITADMVSSLKKGMSKAAVQDIMGTPALTHSLNANRWDYYYFLKPGDGSKIIEKHFSVFFKGDHLVNWQ
jgi:outer membrane protein assembly factor BamE